MWWSKFLLYTISGLNLKIPYPLKYLKLIRLPNLLILAAGMYLMRLMLVEPLLIMSREAPKISSLDFLLMVIGTVLIAAAGNIINDIEDIEIDLINKPEKVIIGNQVSKDQAWNIYTVLTFAGIVIGIYLTTFKEVKYVAYTNLIAAGILYFYSTTYKRMFLLGNMLIAALSAFSIAIVYLTEPAAPTIEPLKIIVTGYVVYAFIISLAREILKDLQDIKGDEVAGCRTLPIVAGVKVSKALALFFTLILLITIIYIQIQSQQWNVIISFLYVVIVIEIPLILLLVSIYISSTYADYGRCSLLSKLIMLAGVLSMPVFYYSL